MRRALFITLASLLLPLGAAASVALHLSLEQLTQRASLIVQGKVTSQHAEATRAGRIVTVVDFAVSERLKGSSAESIHVRHLGGQVGGVAQQVAGEVQFRDGEEAVLFLRPTGLTDGSFAVVGLAQGKFAVTHDLSGGTVAAQNLHGLGTVPAPGAAVEDVPGASLPLAELKGRIARAVAP